MMIVYKAKLEGTDDQYRKLDEALRTDLSVRNACLRYWMDGQLGFCLSSKSYLAQI
ncbi:MAG: hypothetical protein KME21_14460 [Desmonostoc vinosum HA7617-LM4]|jgi:putative transposase|nr:hypothetical protein [Desmonostoc vinosum HA7617-LM4]